MHSDWKQLLIKRNSIEETLDDFEVSTQSLNSVIRHLTMNRKIFSSDDSVKKVIYLAISNAAKKWAMPIQNWCLAINWFTIHFDDRLKDHL